jgi:hypothetical protein
MQWGVLGFACLMLFALLQNNPRNPASGRGIVRLRLASLQTGTRMTFRLWLFLTVLSGIVVLTSILALLRKNG